jgi:hypothetical protein
MLSVLEIEIEKSLKSAIKQHHNQNEIKEEENLKSHERISSPLEKQDNDKFDKEIRKDKTERFESEDYTFSSSSDDFDSSDEKKKKKERLQKKIKDSDHKKENLSDAHKSKNEKSRKKQNVAEEKRIKKKTENSSDDSEHPKKRKKDFSPRKKKETDFESKSKKKDKNPEIKERESLRIRMKEKEKMKSESTNNTQKERNLEREKQRERERKKDKEKIKNKSEKNSQESDSDKVDENEEEHKKKLKNKRETEKIKKSDKDNNVENAIMNKYEGISEKNSQNKEVIKMGENRGFVKSDPFSSDEKNSELSSHRIFSRKVCSLNDFSFIKKSSGRKRKRYNRFRNRKFNYRVVSSRNSSMEEEPSRPFSDFLKKSNTTLPFTESSFSSFKSLKYFLKKYKSLLSGSLCKILDHLNFFREISSLSLKTSCCSRGGSSSPNKANKSSTQSLIDSKYMPDIPIPPKYILSEIDNYMKLTNKMYYDVLKELFNLLENFTKLSSDNKNNFDNNNILNDFNINDYGKSIELNQPFFPHSKFLNTPEEHFDNHVVDKYQFIPSEVLPTKMISSGIGDIQNNPQFLNRSSSLTENRTFSLSQPSLSFSSDSIFDFYNPDDNVSFDGGSNVNKDYSPPSSPSLISIKVFFFLISFIF